MSTTTPGVQAEWKDYLQRAFNANMQDYETPEDARSDKNGMCKGLRASRRAIRFFMQRNPDGDLCFPNLLPIALLVHSVPFGIAAVERSFTDLRTIQTIRRLSLKHDKREAEAYLCFNRHLLKGLLLLPDEYFLPEFVPP